MGRPKKDDTIEAEEPKTVEAPDTPKLCPRCHEAEGEAKKDNAGNWRCYCPKCGYWDSMVYFTEDAARIGWEASGGPEQIW